MPPAWKARRLPRSSPIRPRLPPALNGRPVRGSAELRARLGVVPAGDTVEFKIQRNKETQVIKARIAEVEKNQAAGGQSVPELNGASLTDVERGKNRAVG